MQHLFSVKVKSNHTPAPKTILKLWLPMGGVSSIRCTEEARSVTGIGIGIKEKKIVVVFESHEHTGALFSRESWILSFVNCRLSQATQLIKGILRLGVLIMCSNVLVTAKAITLSSLISVLVKQHVKTFIIGVSLWQIKLEYCLLSSAFVSWFAFQLLFFVMCNPLGIMPIVIFLFN